MAAPRALICGASIAGLSAAFWFRRTGWEVTVLERAASFRDGGQNVDVRGVAHEVLDRMGLTESIAALNTTETGTVMVDVDGEVVTELPSDGPDGATAELEVLRGDFARAILEHLPAGVRFLFDDEATSVEDDGDTVTVTTRQGHVIVVDLLVVAEGVRSTTRDLVSGADVERDDLGITMAFGTIAREADDDDRWRWFTTVGGRQVHLRPDNHGTTRAILAYADDETLLDLPRDEAIERLRRRFADAGWESGRVLDGFATSDDLYIDRLVQIHLPQWHRGRVCLVGDAAWCVTPIGGGGASLALTGGYVLAAFLSTADPAEGVGAALEAYDAWMRPVVDAVQHHPPGLHRMAYPRTRLGLGLNRLVSKALASSVVAPLTERMMSTTDTDQALPPLAVLPRPV